MLLAGREKDGLQIWSYHVNRGRSDEVLADNRAYPVLAAAAGMTGFGYWAYNVSSATTWDDTDGTILDYIFIYDGSEASPLNLKYNTEKERIVPSIRWEAVRAGQQDGQIIVSLQEAVRSGKLPPPAREAVEAAIQKAQALGGPELTGTSDLSFASLRELSGQLRQAYQQSVSEKPQGD